MKRMSQNPLFDPLTLALSRRERELIVYFDDLAHRERGFAHTADNMPSRSAATLLPNITGAKSFTAKAVASEPRLEAEHIVFKQIPYDVRAV